ncbi:hypothetical protein [Hymenobacter koreensis]|uniref:Uncharacterized protein n=1 Tax=Hymenobacter koreensis TaxID=1084523 RepID=A0ABP8IU21_9BACT
MELDDLRRNWKLAATAGNSADSFDSTALTKLLAQGDASPNSKMRRNARLETSFTVLCLLASLAGLFFVEDTGRRVMLLWIMLLCVVSLLSYHRRMTGLLETEYADGNVREYVTQQVANIRRLIEQSVQSVLRTVPVSLGIGMFFSGSRLLTNYSGRLLWTQLALLVAGYGVIWALTHFLLGRLARATLQDLYGQHLDRLEGYLRELQDQEA